MILSGNIEIRKTSIYDFHDTLKEKNILFIREKINFSIKYFQE